MLAVWRCVACDSSGVGDHGDGFATETASHARQAKCHGPLIYDGEWHVEVKNKRPARSAVADVFDARGGRVYGRG